MDFLGKDYSVYWCSVESLYILGSIKVPTCYLIACSNSLELLISCLSQSTQIHSLIKFASWEYRMDRRGLDFLNNTFG